MSVYIYIYIYEGRLSEGGGAAGIKLFCVFFIDTYVYKCINK